MKLFSLRGIFASVIIAALLQCVFALPEFKSLPQCLTDCNRDCLHEKSAQQSISQLNTDLEEIRTSSAYKREAAARRKDPSAYKSVADEIRNTQNIEDLSEIARETYLRTELASAEKDLEKYSAWRHWSVTMLGWDCSENCNYECMHLDNANRVANSRDVVKYNGKWPFIRVLGTQEFFSSFFSFLNAVPHAVFFFKWRKTDGTGAPAGHYMTPIMLSYAVSAVHTWWWSTAFHARDNWFTHNMDYFFATFTIMFMVFFSLVRVFDIRNIAAQLCIAGPLFLYFLYHVYYMLYVKWDYDYNMNLAVLLGVIFCGTWIVVGSYHYIKGTKPYAWKAIAMGSLIGFFAAFEVFDFPPIFGLLDAHAIWHGATPMASWWLWEYLLEDVQKEGYSIASTRRQD